MKKNLLILVGFIVIFGLGFFAGEEYKAYQVRTAIQKAFAPQNSNNSQGQTTNENSIVNQAKQEKDKTIVKHVGDEITLATMKLTINKVTETQTLSGGYGSPKVAPAGSKYVLLDMNVTNLTNASFDFVTSSGFVVVDNKQREFNPVSSIGDVDNYIDVRTLQPSIPENGILVYQLPTDATSYSFNVLKGGVNELYRIILK
jgi:hypothetical protein